MKMSNLEWNLEDIFHNKEEFENAKNELENKIKTAFIGVVVYLGCA